MLSKLTFSAFCAAASAASILEARQSANYSDPDVLQEFIDRQWNISITGAIANIGGANNNIVEAAGTGYVVASPSTINPDYFYTWTRDSALVQLMLIDSLVFGTETVGNNSLQVLAEDYTTAQAQLQTITDPSGALWPAGQGLGEPKFYSNGTRFNGAWGRPQNDGPALRATTFMEIIGGIALRRPDIANQIISTIYWPMIYNDLLYVGQYWNTSSYDLWEEVNGNSFFTMSAQHRALVQGSIWAAYLNKTCEPCEQAPQIACRLQSAFWNETGNYIDANIITNQVNRSEINADPILAAMHNFDINATCDAVSTQPCNSWVLATHKVWVDSFRNLYPINNNATAPNAVLTGRYPEDTYYGGNPWYITTLAAAEVLYDAIGQWNMAGTLSIDNTSLPFWQDIVPDAAEGNYTKSDNMTMYLEAVHTYADGFMALVANYTPANGTLNEQINKTTGEPLSAIALTWSYAAFVTAADRRSGYYPPPWGANLTVGNNVSSTCMWDSYNGTTQYAPANAAGAPNVTMECETEVILNLLYATGPGENTYIVGNTSIFGNTLDNTSEVIQVLRTNNVTNGNPQWFVPAWLPAGIPVEYKYVVLNSTDNSYKFENVSHIVVPPECGNNTVQSITINGTSLYSS